MTLLLLALWIAGHTFQWYWLAATVVFDVLWLAIRLNFIAVLVRRSVEESIAEIVEEAARSMAENNPPPPPPPAG